MPENITLVTEIKKYLPAELVRFIRQAGKVSASYGQSLYLVGGLVRDLLLERTNLDLDFVVIGDAISLAKQLATHTQGKVITHPRFNTAKFQWNEWSIDLATARSETYDRPGALPNVKPGFLASDLFRRDFTINTMAIELVPSRYGQLIDPYGGRNDLNHKFIRILHERSFIDDATRIWRGLRYEQRLNFVLEPHTLQLLKQGIPMIDNISGDRIRHELELILREESPEKVLHRAEELGILSKLCLSLRGNNWLADKFRQARHLSCPNLPSVELYMALLVYRLTDKENEELIAYLKLPKSLAQALRDTNSLKEKLQSLTASQLAPSRIHRLLHGYSQSAIVANSIATDSSTVCQHINLFLSRIRYVKPSITGNDLKRIGISPGPQIKDILQRLLEAKLDGKVTSKREEEEFVKGWINKRTK
ncbi:CCA tRNA nucleotidyltransferase [Chloroflexota bacterium]